MGVTSCPFFPVYWLDTDSIMDLREGRNTGLEKPGFLNHLNRKPPSPGALIPDYYVSEK